MTDVKVAMLAALVAKADKNYRFVPESYEMPFILSDEGLRWSGQELVEADATALEDGASWRSTADCTRLTKRTSYWTTAGTSIAEG